MQNLANALREELKATNGRLTKAARNLNFDVRAAHLRLGAGGSTPTIQKGREELRKYAIAYRPATGEWPRVFKEALADARRKFDAGTHEMVQGRDGHYIIQYLIPRLVPTKPRRFFSYAN